MRYQSNLTTIFVAFTAFNSLTLVPTEIGSLASLQELWLGELKLVHIHLVRWCIEMRCQHNLTTILVALIDDNGLTSLATEIGDLSSLTTLYLCKLKLFCSC